MYAPPDGSSVILTHCVPIKEQFLKKTAIFCVLLLKHEINNNPAQIIHLHGSHCLIDFPCSAKLAKCKTQHKGHWKDLQCSPRDYKVIKQLMD